MSRPSSEVVPTLFRLYKGRENLGRTPEQRREKAGESPPPWTMGAGRGLSLSLAIPCCHIESSKKKAP